MSAFLEESGILRFAQPLYQLWNSESFRLVTSIIGTLVVLSLLIRAALLTISSLRPSNLPIYCHSESGSWALVTGASDGIGRAFSAELLSRGFNVLLHGRNKEKLERVKRELLELHPKRAIEIVVADASKLEKRSYEIVTKKVKKLPGKLTVRTRNEP